MRTLFFVMLWSGIIYTSDIPFIWRFIKKTVYPYYIYFNEPEVDRRTKELITKAAENQWDTYFHQAGYDLGGLNQGTDIVIFWTPVDTGEITYALTQPLSIIGYCGDLPVPGMVYVKLNPDHLPGGSYSGICEFDFSDEGLPQTGKIYLFSVIQHEIGHALGLGHSPYTSSIMYPPQCGESVKYVRPWDGADLIELYQQGCQSVCIGYHYPPDGAQNVPVNTHISITFTRAMDTQSTENAIIIDTDFSKIFEWSNDLKTVTIIPADTLNDLKYETVYTVEVLPSAQDTAGNYMSPECAPYSFSFKTKSPDFELSVVPEHAKVPIGDNECVC